MMRQYVTTDKLDYVSLKKQLIISCFFRCLYYLRRMSKHEKLVKRFMSKPKDFSYNELCTLLSGFGYEELSLGKTSGSRVAFFNDSTKHIIRLHKPHPGNILKRYQIDELITELTQREVLK